jgi:hypothetical protein
VHAGYFEDLIWSIQLSLNRYLKPRQVRLVFLEWPVMADYLNVWRVTTVHNGSYPATLTPPCFRSPPFPYHSRTPSVTIYHPLNIPVTLVTTWDVTWSPVARARESEFQVQLNAATTPPSVFDCSVIDSLSFYEISCYIWFTYVLKEDFHQLEQNCENPFQAKGLLADVIFWFLLVLCTNRNPLLVYL